jgi:multiple sugar transport system substrate-binding protein
MDNIMQSGKLAMYINGPWAIPGLESHDINYGVAQIPAGSAGQIAVLDGTLFAIPTGTDDTQKAAVYDFLKYWNSTANGKRWSMSIVPALPAHREQDPEIQADRPFILAENAKVA